MAFAASSTGTQPIVVRKTVSREIVSPTPSDLRGRKERPMMPAYRAGMALWDLDCADMCK